MGWRGFIEDELLSAYGTGATATESIVVDQSPPLQTYDIEFTQQTYDIQGEQRRGW